jgi:hypothetical protein
VISAEQAVKLLQKDSVTGDWRLDNGVIVSEWDSERTSGRVPLAQVFHPDFGELMAAAPELALTVIALREGIEAIIKTIALWEAIEAPTVVPISDALKNLLDDPAGASS